MPIHVAITRKVHAGKEQEFKEALRRFLGESFLHGGVHGAGMITPLPGDDSREIGILRTFADEAERDAFYESKLFKDWEAYASQVTDEAPVLRQLHGLEAFFRGNAAPARWKMAVVTFLGVYPTSLLLTLAIGEFIHSWPVILRSATMAGLMVAALTWIVMPRLTKSLRPWLQR